MSLLDDALETCVMMDKRTEPDGYGGYISTYTEGAQFKAAIVFDASMEARAAEKQGVTSLYTVTTSRALTLEYLSWWGYNKAIIEGGMERYSG